ncbi:MAG: hypothetical protein HYV96_06575 [Opitutae bacterium]|nr:hypothetical protein [Opitutae bacterium]
MHLSFRSPLFVLSALLASAAAAQSSTTSSSSSNASTTNTTTTASAATTATPQSAPAAPAAVTTPPGATAPNVVVQPPRPVTSPAGDPPQTPSTAVNPLAPNLPPASGAAQAIVNSTTAAPGATAATTLAIEPTNLNELAAAGLDVALNPTVALATLRTAPIANQQTVLRSLQTRVDATTRALIDLRAQARANGVAGAGPNFDQAAEEIRVREIALRDALSSAGSTADEAAWRQAQTQIATLYQAYADAVQRARAFLQPPPQP